MLIALGDLLIGAFLLLLVGALAIVIYGLRKANNAVSFFGWHPLSDIVGWCEDLRHDLLIAFKDSWAVPISLFQDLAHYGASFDQAVVGLFSTHHAQIQHVAHTQVPAAQSAAQSYAHQLTGVERDRAGSAELDLRRSLAAASAAEQALSQYTHGPLQTSLEGYAKQAASDAATAAEQAAVADTAALAREVNMALSKVWAEVGTLQTAVTSTIPKDIAAQARAENADITAAKQADAAALAAQVAALNTKIDNAKASATAALTSAVTAIDQKISAAEDQARTEIAAATKAGDATAAADANAALATATAALTAQKQALQSQITDVAATAAQQLQGEQAQTQKQLATVQGTIQLDQAQTQSGLNTDTLLISSTMAASMSAVAGITAELDNCMVSMCGGPNSLENGLMGLMGLFSAAGELGFIAAAAKDPVGTWAAFEATVEGAAQLGVSTIDGLLSL